MGNPGLNPATKILLWLALAACLPRLGTVPLLAAAIPVVAALVATRAAGALSMLRRSRWLMLSLLLVYAFATPGDPLVPVLGSFSPSLQGLSAGFAQAWRLALLLAALALLMHTCPKESLLAGIYLLLRPLRATGLNPERIAVRLWLTLRYAQRSDAEQRHKGGIQAWWRELRATMEATPDAATQVRFEIPPFTWRDAAAIATGVLALGVVLSS